MTLLDTLGITTISVEKNRVEMRMPVRPEIYQPHGFLHGGATIALLESCASRAAEELTDFDKELIFGLETTIRHKKARKDGVITLDGKPYELHEGESIVMPAKHPHAVYGQEQFKMLLVVVF